jgi:hypothetical protein
MQLLWSALRMLQLEVLCFFFQQGLVGFFPAQVDRRVLSVGRGYLLLQCAAAVGLLKQIFLLAFI